MSAPGNSEIAATNQAVQHISHLVAAAQFEHASSLAQEALAEGLVHPAFFNARALALERQGRNEEALQLFLQARALAPKDPTLLNAIGLCLTRLFRLREAVDAFDESLRHNPAHAVTHQRKAVALGLAGDDAAAESAYRRALQLQPRNIESLAALATIAARKGDLKDLKSFADRALSLDPTNASTLAALALAELSQRDFVAAERILLPVRNDPRLTGHGRAVILGLFGDALDGQDRADEAFEAYQEANAENQRLHGPRFRQMPNTTEMVENLTRYFEQCDPVLWKPPSSQSIPETGTIQHVFLLGFHRSGTTLLEQVLESHPQVVTLEEKDFMAEAAERYLTTAAGMKRLSEIDEKTAESLRAVYWKRVKDYGFDVRGKVFVDKHPFNTIKLPLIAKLFPGAKIILAVRDPRDVILSCFRRQFEIDMVKYEFLSLQTVANLYDRVMYLADICRERLPLAFLQHRYEDLVSDFDGSTQRVCKFIGIAWNENMRDFAVTAQSSEIRSPSADQVRRKLYVEGVGQWRRYETHLKPVLTTLRPWIEKFGYCEM